MRVIGVVRSTETRTIEIEATSYEESRAQLAAKIPEGWQRQTIRTEE